jgi:DNA-binding response OmpR family regulator/anti-sigma regulatory factor (Ser/Thr protein kinase)
MSKILIIDDDRLVIEQISELISSFGHEPSFVPKPSFAIKRLELEEFDLILMDVNMPEINGIELLQMIKAKEEWSLTPIMMMTGEGDQETLSSCFEYGASDYIEKPINAVVLKARVNAILRAQAFTKAELSLKEQEALQYKLRSLISQMNPHFIFNVLNSIQYHIMEENKEIAIKSISEFSKLIRTSLNYSDKDLITMNQEVEFLTTYLNLEADRFRGKLFFDMTVEEGIDVEDIMVPPMLIQPFIENSIVHGIGNKEDQGSIKIHFSIVEGKLQCEIIDDGVGREKARELKKLKIGVYESKGMGLTAVRMDMLNRTQEKGFKANIHDLILSNGEPEGTKVMVEMPLISQWND